MWTISIKLILIYSLLTYMKQCAVETKLNNIKINTNTLTTQEVENGKNAVLLCHSIDDQHLFLFWQLANDNIVIGPSNKFNKFKYDFEILSGNLTIKAVSVDEEGIYYCVSRGIRNDNINIRSVRMIVKRDWDEVDAHDPGVNYFRGVVIVASLLVVAVAIYFLYRLRKRHRIQSLLEASSDEEDSAEEIFRAPSTSAETRNIVIDKANDESAEIPKISIDFEDILINSRK